VVECLYSNSYLTTCPKYVSSRETIANIKLITTAMTIMKRGLLTADMIRHGLNAYELVCRETKGDDNETTPAYLFLDGDKIHRALRLVNMSISENLYNLWFKHVESNLEWSKKERRTFEKALSTLADEQWKQRKAFFQSKNLTV